MTARTVMGGAGLVFGLGLASLASAQDEGPGAGTPARREDIRDARHDGGPRDRMEDRLDRREDRADHREDRRDRRENVRDRRSEQATLGEGRLSLS